jgi:hypothetical protein
VPLMILSRKQVIINILRLGDCLSGEHNPLSNPISGTNLSRIRGKETCRRRSALAAPTRLIQIVLPAVAVLYAPCRGT